MILILRSKAAQKLQEIVPAQRDAACCRCEARPSHMDKHRAAATSHARTGIVIDLDENVVEPVVAPQMVAPFIGRTVKRPVVAPVGRVLAPGVRPPDAPGR